MTMTLSRMSSLIFPNPEDAFLPDPRKGPQTRMPSLSTDIEFCEEKPKFYGISLYQKEENGKHTMEISPMNGVSSPKMLKLQTEAHGSCDEPTEPSREPSREFPPEDAGEEDVQPSLHTTDFLANGWCMTGRLGWGGKLRLRNPKHKLVAIIEERRRLKGGYLILGPLQMYEGQKPYRRRTQTKSPLYVWATVKSKSSTSRGKEWSIKREDNKAKYMAEEVGRHNVRILDVMAGTKCAFAHQGKNSQWDFMVGPEVCPCLMVCVMAIIKCGATPSPSLPTLENALLHGGN